MFAMAATKKRSKPRAAKTGGKAAKAGAAKKTKTKTKTKKWSQRVTETSAALELDAGVFTWDDPVAIARSLKRSAEQSARRKGGPYQSAMSMLNFYINRAGENLPEKRKAILEKAKDALRAEFGRA